MNIATKRRIEAVITEALSLAESGEDEYQAAREALTAQTTDVYRELAVASVVDTIRARRRAAVLRTEREAEGRPRRRRGSEPTPELREEYDRIAEKHEAKLFRTMRDIIDNYTSEIRIQWTAELLASTFKTPDGRTVTWGDATLADHEMRAEQFEHAATVNAEGAARHRKAIADIRAASAESLRELVGQAA